MPQIVKIVLKSACDHGDQRDHGDHDDLDHVSEDLTPPIGKPVPTLTWIDQFRDLITNQRLSKTALSQYFWDNFNWQTQTLWIGKFRSPFDLPETDQQIVTHLESLIGDLNRRLSLRSQIYVKFYFARNIDTRDPEINYLLISDHQKLPEEFLLTQIHHEFERYPLSLSLLNRDKDFRQILNHYLNWSNVYRCFDLIAERHN